MTDHAAALGALSWPLLRAEAIASSRIEGLEVNHHRLAVASADDPAALFVRGNLDALEQALLLASEEINLQTICDIHHALLSQTKDASIAGQLRTTQNWIGGRHPNPRGAAFIPPPEDQLERLLEDLARFSRRDDLPALVQAAIVHVQFETIHPFIDGSGRVGRALILVILRRRGVIPSNEGALPVSPPISLVFASRSAAYVDGLTGFRRGLHEDWLSFFVASVYAAAELGQGLAANIEALQERWRTRAANPRAGSAAAILIDQLPANPIVSFPGALAITGLAREAVRRALNRLSDAGVLHEITGRRRNRRWESVGLFALLDELEASA